MRYRLPKYLYRPILLLLLLLLSQTEPQMARTSSADRDIDSLLRHQRWSKIEKEFSRRRPKGALERYAAAIAILKQAKKGQYSPKSALALSYLTSNQKSSCRNARQEAAFLRCLKRVPTESVTADIKRLSIFKAASYAKVYGMASLRKRLLELINMKLKDPLGHEVFRNRLEAILALKQYDEALLLARRRDLLHLGGPFGDFQRARSFLKKGQRWSAWHYYQKSARSTRASWLRKNIFEDLQKNFADSLQPSQLRERKNKRNRDIVELSEFLDKDQSSALKKSLSARQIIATSDRERLRGDGLYLIHAGWNSAILSLSRKGREQIANSPETVHSWAMQLQKKKKEQLALRLIGSFREILPKDDDLWRFYLDLLKEVEGERDWNYFREILRYLKQFPGHKSVHDRLMALLLAPKGNRIDWASNRFWKEALEQMPHYTASGRFIYWSSRYYAAKKMKREQAEILQSFYLRAPGSFYAKELWKARRERAERAGRGQRQEQKESGTAFHKDWGEISDRNGYLRWIGKYGDEERSIAFLHKRRPQSYLDPRAVKLWQDLSAVKLPTSGMVRLLFRTGDWVKGVQYFREMQGDSLSQEKYLMTLVRLAVWSRHLNVQIHYTRRLMHLKGIPADPFSLPPGIGRLLYPRPYYPTVRKFAKKYKIGENMIYALAHQESLFRETAVSRTGARGLMQIMPRTGNWLARLMGWKGAPDLYQPATNIELGARYFSRLLKNYNSSFQWAAIGYNGGPGNLRKWKRSYYRDDFYLFLERLPNRESRNYCRITTENWMHYETLYGLYP